MMLPAFRIKNLPPIAAPNTRAYDGRIEISEAEYDTLCLWHPVARLKYTHEDGEIVTIGSSIELKEYLETTSQRRKAQNITHGQLKDTDHIFFISELAEAIGRWRVLALRMPILGPHSRNHHAAPIGDLKSLSAPEASILNSSFPRLATRDPSLRQSLALEPDRITPDDPRNCYFIASNPPQPFSGTRCTSDNGKNVFDGIFPALSTARASESRFPSSGLTPIGRRQAISAADQLHKIPNALRNRISGQRVGAPDNRWASYVATGSAFSGSGFNSVHEQAALEKTKKEGVELYERAEATKSAKAIASRSLMQIFEAELGKIPKGDHPIRGSHRNGLRSDAGIDLKRIRNSISKINSTLGDLHLQEESTFTLVDNDKLDEELQASLYQFSDCTHRTIQSLQSLGETARNAGSLIGRWKIAHLNNVPSSPFIADKSSARHGDGHKADETSFIDEHSDLSTLSKVQSCIESLQDFGYDRRIQDRLVIYAQAADGDLEAAIDLIEDDRRVSDVGIRL